MPELTTFSVGPLSTNCYLISQQGQGIIIDPGDDGDFLSQELRLRGLTLQATLLTHGHFDHCLGLLPLHLNFPDAPIYLALADYDLYSRAVSSAAHWVPGYSPDPPPHTSILTSPPPIIHNSKFIIHTISTPGHTQGSLSYYFPQTGWLFTGDTLFKAGVGRTDLSYSDPATLRLSLLSLAKLPPTTTIYPGHGEPTTLQQEHLS